MHYIERGYRWSFPDSLRQCLAASFKMVVFFITGTRLPGTVTLFILLPGILAHVTLKMGRSIGIVPAYWFQ